MIRTRFLTAIPYPGVVVGLWMVITIVLAFPGPGFGVLFPFIQEDLQATRLQLGLIGAGLTAGGGATVLLLGWLVDVVGVRRVEAVALLWLAAALLLFSQIQHVWQGVLVAVLIGTGRISSLPAVNRAIMDWVPQRIRAGAMGTIEASITAGAIIAAVLLTYLALAHGWRTGVMVVAIIIGAVSIAFIAIYRDKPSGQIDGGIQTKSRGKFGQVASNQQIWLVAFVGISVGAPLNIIGTYLVLFLREHLDMSPGGAGGLLAIAMAGGVIGRVGWCLVSDFFLNGRRVGLLTFLGALAVASLSLMALLPSDASLILASLLVLIIGITIVGRTGLLVVLIAELAGPGLTGTAMGFASTIWIFGGIGFIPLFGFIVDQTDSYAMGWWMTAAMAGTGTLMMGFLRERERPN